MEVAPTGGSPVPPSFSSGKQEHVAPRPSSVQTVSWPCPQLTQVSSPRTQGGETGPSLLKSLLWARAAESRQTMSGGLETQADIAVVVTVTPRLQDFLCRQKL